MRLLWFYDLSASRCIFETHNVYKVKERQVVKNYSSTHNLDKKDAVSQIIVGRVMIEKKEIIQLSVLDGRFSTGS